MTKVILIGSGSEKVLMSHALRERGITIIQPPELTPLINIPNPKPIELRYHSLSYPDGNTRRRERRKKKRKLTKNK